MLQYTYSGKISGRGGDGNINEMIAHLLDFTLPSNPFRELYQFAQIASSNTSSNDKKLHAVLQLCRLYWKGVKSQTADKGLRKYGPLLMHSLYFPAVYHWYASVPQPHIMVVPGEEIGTKTYNFERVVLLLVFA